MELDEIAEQFSVMRLMQEERLFSQGDRGESFYIVLKGAVRVELRKGKEERVLARLVPGDYFGEEAILSGRRRSASIIADKDSFLLRMDSDTFRKMLKDHPQIRPNLEITIESHSINRSKNFKWLKKDEQIYDVARKHPAIVVIQMGIPVLIILFSFFVMYLGAISGSASPYLVGGAILTFGVGLAIWRYIDWGNDYYVITNQRVVWIEKVVGLYESQDEAPLSTILSTGVSSDYIGQWLGFGNVIVRTIAGEIVMRNVKHPEAYRTHIDEYWTRTKEKGEAQKTEAMWQAIEKEIEMPEGFVPPPKKKAPQKKPPKEGFSFKKLLGVYFYTRYEEGNIITYHKHWFLLLRQAWWQTLLLATVFALIVLNFQAFLQNQTIEVVATALLVVFGGWWLYEYVDWRNDQYQVTPEQIMDIDRKPFGTETRNTAPLENIQNLSHTRKGIIASLLNFGNVEINISGSIFTFEGVSDPARVRQDIFQKYGERKKKLDENKAREERERMAKWIATYHRHTSNQKPT